MDLLPCILLVIAQIVFVDDEGVFQLAVGFVVIAWFAGVVFCFCFFASFLFVALLVVDLEDCFFQRIDQDHFLIVQEVIVGQHVAIKSLHACSLSQKLVQPGIELLLDDFHHS